jgi:hypothetical protein
MTTGGRIRRPLFLFMAILLVFMLSQVGVERVFLVVQEKANGFISNSSKFLAFFFKISKFEANCSTNSSILVQLSLNDYLPTTTTGFLILPAPTGPTNATADRLTDDQVFIRSAFRVSDSEIRLTILKEHKSR